MKRKLIGVLVALLLWAGMIAALKIDAINSEYQRNIREHPPGGRPTVIPVAVEALAGPHWPHFAVMA